MINVCVEMDVEGRLWFSKQRWQRRALLWKRSRDEGGREGEKESALARIA